MGHDVAVDLFRILRVDDASIAARAERVSAALRERFQLLLSRSHRKDVVTDASGPVARIRWRTFGQSSAWRMEQLLNEVPGVLEQTRSEP